MLVLGQRGSPPETALAFFMPAQQRTSSGPFHVLPRPRGGEMVGLRIVER